MNEEQKAMEAYKEAGVDLPELNEQPSETKEEAHQEPEAPETKKPEEPTEPLQETEKLERKRSIYDEYKEKKAELKSERELREQAERERDEFRTKYEALQNADTPEERQEAQDELETFAKEINADPQALRKMRELFLKDVKPQTNDELARDLQEFKAWKSQNSELMEKQMFEDEFRSSMPTLKEMLPNASDEEMQKVKETLDNLSHSKEFHDKDLEYIAWKHRSELSALISPRKRGLESKGKTDIDENSFEFDPTADYSQMSPKQKERWEAEYRKLTSSTDLGTDASGRKVLL
jgi:hypothetical protein